MMNTDTNIAEVVKSTAVGITGAAGGVVLEQVSLCASILVSCLTALYLILKILDHFKFKKKAK